MATVEIPGTELDDYGRANVEQALAKFTVGRAEYRLVGASGSAKNGRYHAVNKEFEKAIAERFQQWPEAAVTYFGILISPCKVRIEEPDAGVLIVEDHSLGTNGVRRGICRPCGKTFTVLPDWLAPAAKCVLAGHRGLDGVVAHGR